MLKVHKTKIIDKTGKPVILKGVNLGGWLMMEGYILHSLNFAEQLFRRSFEKNLGKKALLFFERDFRENFIGESDFQKISSLGFNCVRLPFHFRLIEKSPYRFDRHGLELLTRAVRRAKKFGLRVILDLHAAPGAQNCDWHSDSLGQAEFWAKTEYRERACAIWEFLADKFKNEPAVAGYDLLNESVTENAGLLNTFYRNVVRRIRSVDRNHIIFVEGNKWGQDLSCLDDFSDDNLALSAHFYQPLDFTFNFVPHLRYPFTENGQAWNKDVLHKLLLPYAKLSQKRKRPVYVGEFGVNARGGVCGEEKWLEDTLSCFTEFGFHWTYWTYKAVKNNVFPDGIFSYLKNPPWVNRAGPLLGWDTYSRCWPEKRKEMTASWLTSAFKENGPIVKALTYAAR